MPGAREKSVRRTQKLKRAQHNRTKIDRRDWTEEETMETRLNLSGNGGELARSKNAGHGEGASRQGDATGAALALARVGPLAARHPAQLPASVQESVAARRGEYDARRLRSQREVIRDVMLAAADCDTWLTLGELRALTRYGEASISAQLRHLRKLENGGYEVAKRHREGFAAAHPAADGRGECVWEYRVAHVIESGQGARPM
jgi:hypothetical protein